MSHTVTLPAGTIKRGHVRKDLAGRLARGEDVAVCVVQTSKGPVRGREITFEGPVTLTQRKRLNCGARVYFETHGEVTVYGVDGDAGSREVAP